MLSVLALAVSLAGIYFQFFWKQAKVTGRVLTTTLSGEGATSDERTRTQRVRAQILLTNHGNRQATIASVLLQVSTEPKKGAWGVGDKLEPPVLRMNATHNPIPATIAPGDSTVLHVSAPFTAKLLFENSKYMDPAYPEARSAHLFLVAHFTVDGKDHVTRTYLWRASISPSGELVENEWTQRNISFVPPDASNSILNEFDAVTTNLN